MEKATSRVHSPQQRVGQKVTAEPPGVGHLRREVKVRPARRVAEAERPVGGTGGECCFQCHKRDADPMLVPSLHARLIHAEPRSQVLAHAVVVERVQVAGDELREGPRLRPPNGVGGKQRRPRMRLLKVFEDCAGLGDDMLAHAQRRHKPLRVDRLVLAGAERPNRNVLVIQTLEVQRDADPFSRRVLSPRVELHLPSIKRMRAGCEIGWNRSDSRPGWCRARAAGLQDRHVAREPARLAARVLGHRSCRAAADHGAASGQAGGLCAQPGQSGSLLKFASG